MKFGVCLPNFGRSASRKHLDRVLEVAEDLYDSVWSTDHVVVPTKYADPYGFVYDSLLTLAYAAARTENVSIGTSVLVLPQRNPVIVAKQAATIDQLSNGRLILGIGVGWMEEEFSFLGANFDGRGALMDESIELMRTLWQYAEPWFRGRFFKLEGVDFQPAPAQSGGPPLWIGGVSKVAIRRAARIGDGWHPVGLSAQELEVGVSKLRRFAANDRKLVISLRSRIAYSDEGPSEYHSAQGTVQRALGGSARQLAENLEEYRKAGLEHLICYFGASEPELALVQMRDFAVEVVPSFDE